MSAKNQTLGGTFGVTTAGLDVDWDAVYRRELPRVYNYFRYRLGDDARAEDLTSATFEKAWRKRDSYRRDAAAFSTWLLTIARNVATDEWRARRAVLPLETLAERAAPDSPEENYARRAELEQLGALLAELEPDERELVALKYGAELNNREIAAHLGLGESNVGTILYRVVGKLRRRWAEDERGGTGDGAR
jgi:RNA polymerase sigma-70 factor (ECF subfamily)